MTQQSHCWAYTLRKPELKETHILPMFITALFIIARMWKQPRCPSADEWIRKLWYIYTMEYYTAIKKNTFESVPMRWMKLELIIQNEVSQKEKHQYSILLLGRKVMINLDSIFKSRDITLPTKVRLVKAMVFPVVMYGCESWIVKKAECRRTDSFEL